MCFCECENAMAPACAHTHTHTRITIKVSWHLANDNTVIDCSAEELLTIIFQNIQVSSVISPLTREMQPTLSACNVTAFSGNLIGHLAISFKSITTQPTTAVE